MDRMRTCKECASFALDASGLGGCAVDVIPRHGTCGGCASFVDPQSAFPVHSVSLTWERREDGEWRPVTKVDGVRQPDTDDREAMREELRGEE